MSVSQQEYEAIQQEGIEQKWIMAHRPRPVDIDTAALMRTSNDPTLAARQSELLGTVYGLDAEVKSLTSEVNAAEVVELKRLHKQLWVQARKAKDALAASVNPIAAAINNERETSFEWNREFAKLTEVNNARLSASDFPTDSEWEVYFAKVKRQETKLRAVEDRLHGHKQHLQELQAEQNVLQIAFDKAVTEVEKSQRRIDLLEGKKSSSSSVTFKEKPGLGF